MHASLTSLLVAALAGSAAAAPQQQQDQEPEVYNADNLNTDTSPFAIEMPELQRIKLAQHDEERAAGTFDMDKYPEQAATKCKNGKAGPYSCKNIDLKGFLRHQDMGTKLLQGNDVWGWTSEEGREFGIVGQVNGTAFVEVMDNGSLRYMGRLDTQTTNSTWRDAKVIGDHAYIGSEAPGHGVQVFDLNKLLDIDPKKPKVFSTKKDLASHINFFGSSHNIVANEKTDLIIAVGTRKKENEKCAGGLWMIDVKNPKKPKDLGCFGEDGYSHDAECVIYKGPDKRYKGHEICFGYNEDTLTVVDITKRKSPKLLSRTTYIGASYTHQGWLATDDMSFLLLDDEIDEIAKRGPAKDGKTATYIVNIKNLERPIFEGVYKSPVKAIDHNQYVIDGLAYQSNYASGLRVVDVSTIKEDPTGRHFEEVGFFDVHPEDDKDGAIKFVGAWSVYPYFESGHILINSIERGVFSVKFDEDWWHNDEYGLKHTQPLKAFGKKASSAM